MEYEREIAEQILGPRGRMISLSKTYYRLTHSTNGVVFNANVRLRSGKIWYGDLDLTRDESLILRLADELYEGVFVFDERDGRFASETRPLLALAVYIAAPDGRIGHLDSERFERDKRGRIRRRPPLRGNRN